jgi:NDP-sugar pyrophosphorylase family protein
MPGDKQELLLTEPLACVEVLGQSVGERTINRFLAAGIDAVTVLIESTLSNHVPFFSSSNRSPKLKFRVVYDLNQAIVETTSDYAQGGLDHAFITSAETYAEADLLDFFYFHREARQGVTRAYDSHGWVDLWAVECETFGRPGLGSLQTDLLQATPPRSNSYFIRDYVNCMLHPRNLRQLASDVLQGHCETSPSGRELRAGIWVDDGAEVHRGSRIVAPAYIGCGSTVSDATLITRFSSIERGCRIDCGTVIDDSSVLANTHVGIWLDVCKAVVTGNKLLSLTRDVMVEISDPRILRSTRPVLEVASLAGVTDDVQLVAPDPPQLSPSMPDNWQLGVNLIQE